MVTTQQVTWREYTVEFLTAYAVVLVMVLALFRAPSSLVHIISAVFFALLFTVMRKRMITFGNPVISLAMLGLRKISPKLALALISFQLAAGALAGLTVHGMIDDIGTRLEGLAGFTKLSFSSGLGELLGAFFFVAGIMALMNMYRNNTDDGSSIFGMFFVTYASMLTAALLGSIGFINPGVAFATGLHFNIIYTIIPLVGGILGAAFYTTVIEGRKLSLKIGRSHASHITE